MEVEANRCARPAKPGHISVPDLPGCFSVGDTLDEAITLHQADPDFADWVWAVVDVLLSYRIICLQGDSQNSNIWVKSLINFMMKVDK